MNQLISANNYALIPENFGEAMRLAEMMASARMVPAVLQKSPADCLQVIMQAVRWGMDPFAVAQCVSVISGKICYEGKAIAAALDTCLGVQLEYKLSGQGEQMKVVVRGVQNGKVMLDADGTPKEIEGTVADWKTRRDGSPWSAPGGYPRMLRYRGAREWARTWAPSILMGVYGTDEFESTGEAPRGRRDTVTGERQTQQAAPALAAPKTIDHDPQTGEVLDDGIPGFLDRRETPAATPHAAAGQAALSDGAPPEGAADLSDDGPDPKAEFIASCRKHIAAFRSPAALSKWWTSKEQVAARRDFELTEAEVKELLDIAVAKRDQLQGNAA